jgi:hypothetical protein
MLGERRTQPQVDDRFGSDSVISASPLNVRFIRKRTWLGIYEYTPSLAASHSTLVRLTLSSRNTAAMIRRTSSFANKPGFPYANFHGPRPVATVAIPDLSYSRSSRLTCLLIFVRSSRNSVGGRYSASSCSCWRYRAMPRNLAPCLLNDDSVAAIRTPSISFKALWMVPLTRLDGASHPDSRPLLFTVSNPNQLK